MHKIDFHTPKYMMVYDICINITAINSNCDTTKKFRAGLLFCVVFWSALVMVAKGSSIKKRLCVQYKIRDFNVSMIALSTLSGMTRSVCFLECVRHQLGHSPCRGFHFRPKEGVCELLPEESVCMTGSVVLGTTYVHLSDCTFMATYHGINPGPGPLRWFTNLAIQKGVLHFQSALGAVRYVVRVLHKGMWLPGWGKHSFQQESRVLMGCSLNVVLTFSLSIHLTRFHIVGFHSPWETQYQPWPLSQVTGPTVRLSISYNWLYPT